MNMSLPARLVERILLVIGLACVGVYLLTWVDQRVEQARENRELDRILASRRLAVSSPRPGDAAPAAAAKSSAPKTVLGRIEIPRLGVSATVREGDDASTLRRAVGHIPGTALPGDLGNAAFAAHRDTFFSRLKDIRRQDAITFTAPDGVHEYLVQDTRVVAPTDVSVLEPTTSATLTLVTCYPFNYIGSAPQRFIVRAVRRDVVGTVGVTPAVQAIDAKTSTAKPATIKVIETETVAKPLPRAKTRVASARTVRTAAPAPRAKSNAFARFFKAAARGLGFAPRESRAATQTESPDPRNPGR
jgi:sortase A